MAVGVEQLAVAVAGVAAAWDLRTRRIPNALTYAVLVAALLLALLPAAESGLLARLGGTAAPPPDVVEPGPRLLQCLAGMAVGFLPCFLLFRQGALGGGDVKLAAALGGLLGAARVLDVLVVAVVLGALLALPIAWWRRSFTVGVPFAVPLLAALVLVLRFGPIAGSAL